MRFVTRQDCKARFEGKTVAIVGGGPGAALNDPGIIDRHDVVVRVNNYKLTGPRTGKRTDVFYSFFGSSIRKRAEDLIADGVTLCMNKCPDAHPIQSEWHELNCKMIGVDFRPHFRRRASWWFCDTYIPTVDEFMVGFNLLRRRMPTTGFSAILDIVSFNPRSIYLTGFDFYSSKIHNLNERWRPANAADPIGHHPRREQEWLVQNMGRYPINIDRQMKKQFRPTLGKLRRERALADGNALDSRI